MFGIPNEQVFGALGGILSALLVFVAARQAAKGSAKAALAATAVADRQSRTDEFVSIISELRKDLDRLQGRIEDLEERTKTDAALIESLRSENRTIENLHTAEIRAADLRYSAAIDFIGELLHWGAELNPKVKPPPPPAALADDLK